MATFGTLLSEAFGTVETLENQIKETSQKLKQLFSETEEILRFECSYSKSFNKYVPLKITDESLTEI